MATADYSLDYSGRSISQWRFQLLHRCLHCQALHPVLECASLICRHRLTVIHARLAKTLNSSPFFRLFTMKLASSRGVVDAGSIEFDVLGDTLPPADAQLVAIAKVHELLIVKRNT